MGAYNLFSFFSALVHDLTFNAWQKVTIKMSKWKKVTCTHAARSVIRAMNYECEKSSENYLRQFFSIYLYFQVIFLHLRCAFFCSNLFFFFFHLFEFLCAENEKHWVRCFNKLLNKCCHAHAFTYQYVCINIAFTIQHSMLLRSRLY